MSTGSSIEWTDATWNPIAGCTPVSPGCLNCYAATMAHRLEAMGQEKYRGLTVLNNGLRVFSGKITLDEKALAIPLGWKKPRKIFVNSMSDLFHESVPFGFVDKVFAVMALCPQHTFQVLTKRPERMKEYMLDFYREGGRLEVMLGLAQTSDDSPFDVATEDDVRRLSEVDVLPNVWLGASCEDQPRADELIPYLLKCPAAVRFLSCEPLLGEVDLCIDGTCSDWACHHCGSNNVDTEVQVGPYDVSTYKCDNCGYFGNGEDAAWKSLIHWVIVGGESGPKARPCNVEWIRSIVKQCAAAGVPVFVKQLGATPQEFHDGDDMEVCDTSGILGLKLRDKKGGDMAEWPEDLRVRQMPEVRRDSPEGSLQSSERLDHVLRHSK